jgi:hypothetical protein
MKAVVAALVVPVAGIAVVGEYVKTCGWVSPLSSSSTVQPPSIECVVRVSQFCSQTCRIEWSVPEPNGSLIAGSHTLIQPSQP